MSTQRQIVPLSSCQYQIQQAPKPLDTTVCGDCGGLATELHFRDGKSRYRQYYQHILDTVVAICAECHEKYHIMKKVGKV